MGFRGPGRDLQGNKPPGLANYGQKMWKHMSDASKRKEKQKWTNEKQKLGNAKDFVVFTSMILRMKNSRIL